MANGRERLLDFGLGLVGILYGLVGLVSILPALGGAFFGFVAGALYSLTGTLLLGILIAFPIVCLGSSLGIWILKKKNKRTAFLVSLLPLVALASVVAAAIFSDASARSALLQQAQGNDSRLAQCTAPVLDGGDGLDTTGCGGLEAGVTAAGITRRISEAQNWKFSTASTQIAITVESNGTCPHIRILDSSGKVVESFKERNSTQVCPSGMVTTAFFNANLPAGGTYTLRLITPVTPGAYWLKIR